MEFITRIDLIFWQEISGHAMDWFICYFNLNEIKIGTRSGSRRLVNLMYSPSSGLRSRK